MQFRFQDKRGKVHTLSDVASLLGAIRDGAITPETPLAVGSDRTWHSAYMVAAYREAVAAMRRSGGEVALAVALPAVPAGPVTSTVSKTLAGRRGRLAGVALLVVLGVGFAGFRLRDWSLGPVGRASAAAGPALGAQAAAAEIEGDFGDSVAVEQRRIHDWVRGQRFDVRFRGISLASESSLRTALVAAERYRMEVRAAVTGLRNLSVRMVARADSLELAQDGLEGLTGATDDALALWRHDLDSWAEIQTDIAANLDALADFLLIKQRSYVIRDGRPVFLSRDDGARFRELMLGPGQLAMREDSWANTVRERRPRWMETLPAAKRPEFGRSIFPVR